jgi:hypothetical protein
MSSELKKMSTPRVRNCAWGRLAGCLLATTLLSIAARATENDGSVYPVGAETVLQGMMPAPHATGGATFTLLYAANQVDDANGKPISTDFKVRCFANAVKVVHNWGIPVLGGMLESTAAAPFIDEQLHGAGNSIGLSNLILDPVGVIYNKGNWHGFYQLDFYTPGTPYSKTAAINIGQHNFALAPVGAFTYLSSNAKWEASSKANYIVNFKDGDTNYRSGNELTWEYTATRAISKKAALGFNGYLYQQTTGDQLNGVAVGNKGRDLAVGPQLRVFFGKHSAFAVKYFRDTLVENKPRGNGFWFETGFPLNFGKKS